MRINLALANILNSIPRTLLSLAGIGVAIILIFMQLGFRGAVEDTAVNIYNKLDFDILVRSPDYLHFIDSSRIRRDVLDEIAGLEPVESVTTLKISMAPWRTPIGEFKGILLLAIDPVRSPFLDDSINQELIHLNSLDAVLVDDRSHREFAPLNGRKFTAQDVGRVVRIADQPMRIIGIFTMGAGLAANGAGLVSHSTLDRLVPRFGPQTVSFGLVKIKPGESAEQIARALSQRFTFAADGIDAEGIPASVEILPRQEVFDRELRRWMKETPIGFIFTLGVMIAFLVGAAMVYMVLRNDVANRLHEYATLRAMGYPNGFLARVVLRQATYLALFSFVPALLLSIALYWLTGTLASVGLEMSWQRILFVFALTFVMCFGSGTLALKKLWQAEPADLF
jgi:putative ABC transport system permease protein